MRAYPLWVSAGHGHHQSLAERLANSSIATEWLSHYKSQELTGKYATFEIRPVVGIRLPFAFIIACSRMRPFSILEKGMIAGYGDSGKLHNLEGPWALKKKPVILLAKSHFLRKSRPKEMTAVMSWVSFREDVFVALHPCFATSSNSTNMLGIYLLLLCFIQ